MGGATTSPFAVASLVLPPPASAPATFRLRRWGCSGSTLAVSLCSPEVDRATYCGCGTCEQGFAFYNLTRKLCVSCWSMPLVREFEASSRLVLGRPGLSQGSFRAVSLFLTPMYVRRLSRDALPSCSRPGFNSSLPGIPHCRVSTRPSERQYPPGTPPRCGMPDRASRGESSQASAGPRFANPGPPQNQTPRGSAYPLHS